MAVSAHSLPDNRQSPTEAVQAERIEHSRALLEQVSAQLIESHALLEAQVDTLKRQLADVHAQRTRELAEKACVTARLQNLLDLLPGGVVVLDGRGVVREANPVARELLGEPLEGQLWRDLIQERFAPREDDYHEVSLRSGRRVSLATRSLRGEPGQLILINDLTETRELQARLARHERLSALGRMVASLAHQIRTPLSTALLYASHLGDDALSLEQRQRFSLRLKDRLQAMEQQVRDMLLFARGDLPLEDRLTPPALFERLRLQAEPVLEQAGIKCRWVDLCPPQGWLRCNAETLVSALLNLVENACQAGSMSSGLKVVARRLEGQLSLCVVDNGPGMSAELLARLAEPFHTTKPQGTGLGLAVVKSVARAHGGAFHLRSKVGRGTCAEVLLPIQFGGEE